ncbi:cell division protein FtsA [Limobrevibacterium gyesilva]|uniref:Cell division protein FtsA n=1 Tax=Limobrevibacterium gyesilva TaxID=2991712 RepID=A0AA41YSG5_9PROT|nr:cell division protein FtsA [Limobrevibacterium gyesilva]
MNDLSRRILTPPDEPAEPTRARPRHTGPFGVLDIGTTKIACVIGRVESDGSIRVIGFGWQKGRGVRGGGILDIEEAERAIRAAVGQAEEEAGTRLRAVTVNLSAGQPESRLFNVQWPVGGRAVTEQDIRRVLSEGRARAASENRSIIHALPLAFAADDAQGVIDPRGLHCETLVARLHVVDAVTTALRSLDACLARCDLEIAELVSAPMAAGMATLVEDERLLGATVLDMGGGTTGMAVFAEGQLLHTAQLPVGGAHVTNDIARVLSTPVAHAERLKTLYGSAQSSPDDEREMLPVPLVGEEEHQIAKVPRSMVVNIIKPRLEETFEMVKERLEGSGLARAAGHRVVLTGGASQLSGARDMAHRVLGRQVRAGRPAPLRGLPDSASGPAFATAVGLLAWTAGEGRTLHDLDLDAERPSGLLRRFVNFLRERV